MRELSWRQRGRLWMRLGLRLLILVAVCFLALRVAFPLVRLMTPFVVALILTWMLNPAVTWLEKRMKVKRNVLSLMLVMLALAAAGTLVAGLVYALVGQVMDFLRDWQSWWGGTMEGIDALAQAIDKPLRGLPGPTYDRLVELGDSITAWLGDAVPRMLTAAAGNAGSFAMSLPSVAISVVICIMATYFISADYPNLRCRATRWVPQEFRGFLSHVRGVVKEAFGGYIRAQLILSTGVFFILLAGFLLTREPYALLLSFVFAVLDFIPIIGAGTVMIPWAVVDVVLGRYAHAAGLLVVWGIVAIFRRVAEPRVVGDQTGLSPVASLASIYVGMRLGGVVGMVLGPVVCLTVVNVIRGGFFRGTARDLQLALGDAMAILQNSGPKDPGK